jgi:hypothetical protein
VRLLLDAAGPRMSSHRKSTPKRFDSRACRVAAAPIAGPRRPRARRSSSTPAHRGGTGLRLDGAGGYGKTTLLVQWSRRDPRPFAWVRLMPGSTTTPCRPAFPRRVVPRGSPQSTTRSCCRSSARPLRPDTVPGASASKAVRRPEPFVLVVDNATLHRPETHEIPDCWPSTCRRRAGSRSRAVCACRSRGAASRASARASARHSPHPTGRRQLFAVVGPRARRARERRDWNSARRRGWLRGRRAGSAGARRAARRAPPVRRLASTARITSSSTTLESEVLRSSDHETLSSRDARFTADWMSGPAATTWLTSPAPANGWSDSARRRLRRGALGRRAPPLPLPPTSAMRCAHASSNGASALCRAEPPRGRPAEHDGDLVAA